MRDVRRSVQRRLTEGDEDDAQDITQDAFARVWARRGNYAGAGVVGVEKIVFTTARRLTSNWNRDRVREQLVVAELQPRVRSVPRGWVEDQVAVSLGAQAIMKVAEELTELQREVLLGKAEGLSNKEIAEKVGRTEGGVKSAVFTMRRKMRLLLGEKLGAPR